MNSKTIVTICGLMITAPVFAQVAPAAGRDSVATAVEREAEYPGGVTAWSKYIQANVSNKAPEADAPFGKYTVIVKFIVDKTGQVTNVAAETKFGYGMEEEAIRVVTNSGKWTPASQNGRNVNAYRRQPFTFLKETTDFTITTKVPYTLYTNTDNEITVTAKKVAPENISISVTGGKVLPGTDGHFIVRFSKPGRAVIEITNAKKDDKLIGTASIEVNEK